MIWELTGKAIGLYCETLISINPDFVILLGDRYEAVAMAIAAHFKKMKIIHLHGGNQPRSFRRCGKKCNKPVDGMHFTSLDKHKLRVKDMVGKSNYVEAIGPMCIDNIRNMKVVSKDLFEIKTKYKFTKKHIDDISSSDKRRKKWNRWIKRVT